MWSRSEQGCDERRLQDAQRRRVRRRRWEREALASAKLSGAVAKPPFSQLRQCFGTSTARWSSTWGRPRKTRRPRTQGFIAATAQKARTKTNGVTRRSSRRYAVDTFCFLRDQWR